MSYRIAAIDVHKKMLAVVVSDVEVESEYMFERRKFSSNPEQLRSLAAWLLDQEAEEVVMESTAQYWKPVWEALERYWKPSCEKREGARRKSGTLHLAQALSNRGRQGRKRDFPDAERLVKRLVAQELTLSFVPDAEQRLWRTVTRKKHQLRCDRIRLQNQLESLLEEAHIQTSSLLQPALSQGQSSHATFTQSDGECRSQDQRKYLPDRVSPEVPRLGHNQTIGAIAHRQCRLIWLILHEGVRYEERGSGLSKRSKQLRTWKMIRQLRELGYPIEPPISQPSQAPGE